MTAMVLASSTLGLLLTQSSTTAFGMPDGYLSDPTVTLASATSYMSSTIDPRSRGVGVNADELFVTGYEVLLLVPCATGQFNADEDWIAYLHIGTRDLMYRKLGAPVAQEHAPCTRILTQAHASRKRDPVRRAAARATIVEVFDDHIGGYVAVDSQPMKSIPLLRDGELGSLDMIQQEDKAEEHKQREPSLEDSCGRGRFFEEIEFNFTASVDTLDGIRRRTEYPLASDAFVATVDFVERDDFEADNLTIAGAYHLLEQVLQDERQFVSQSPTAGPIERTWLATFSLDDWARLRADLPLLSRQALSEHWTVLAKIMLVASNNATTGLNCLRRAICWNPSHVPAYLQMVSILEHYGHQNASCQIMENLLAHVDPADFGSGEMRTILTTNFSHCSVIIRMANVWERSPLVRYVLAASVVVSFVHGIFVACSFLFSRFQHTLPGNDRVPSLTIKPKQQHRKG